MTNSSIMIQGTGSHVGKSIFVCALCRILKQDGYRIAPFKAQNMALNSFVTRDGKEIGRAQVAQAEAAGIDPVVEMNPILLKPTGDCSSQVVVMGKPIGNMTAKEYYQKKNEFVSIIKDAYDKLRSKFDIIVIEGAGSPAEINLKDDDIVNMGMAEMASAPVLLVTDIDRGGAFAWIVGTLELLTTSERERVKGIVFNKFRGDKSILKPGLDMLENRINKPVIGVIPYIHNLSIDDEDSVSLEFSNKLTQYRAENLPFSPPCEGGTLKNYYFTSPSSPPCEGGEIGVVIKSQNAPLDIEQLYCNDTDITGNGFVDIVVIKLPRISNFTDFNTLTHEKDVRVRFVDKVENIGKPDLLIIPGTKNTIGDLTFLRERGIFREIIERSRQGTMTIGICGGYQMLGKQINDPHHVESLEDSIQGLNLLDTATTFATEKQTYQVKARMLEHENLFHTEGELVGYEIHMGETTFNGRNPVRSFARITERAGEMVDILDGCVSVNGNVIGTYIHGIFDNDEFRSGLINYLRLKKGLKLSDRCHVNFKSIKEHRYNELADVVRRNINMNLVYSIMQ